MKKIFPGLVLVGLLGAGCGGATERAPEQTEAEAAACRDIEGAPVWSHSIDTDSANDGLVAETPVDSLHAIRTWFSPPSGACDDNFGGLAASINLANDQTGAFSFPPVSLCWGYQGQASDIAFSPSGENAAAPPAAPTQVTGICLRVAKNHWSGASGSVREIWEIWAD